MLALFKYEYYPLVIGCEKKKLLWIYPLIVLICGCATLPPSREVGLSPNPRAEEIRLILRDRMIIPVVDLQNATVSDAVDFMFMSARKHDPKRQGVSFVLKLGDHADRQVTIRSKDISVWTLLNDICSQADLVWRITNTVILIEPTN